MIHLKVKSNVCHCWQEVNKMIMKTVYSNCINNTDKRIIIVIKSNNCYKIHYLFIYIVVFWLATNHLFIFGQTNSKFPIAQVVDNSINFFLLSSQAIFSSSSSNLGSCFGTILKVHSIDFATCLCVCASATVSTTMRITQTMLKCYVKLLMCACT